GGFQQDGSGLVSMEAESYQASVVSPDGHEWLSVGASFGGYSGTDALRALPEDTVSNPTSYSSLSPRLDYEVNFVATGTHYVWVRVQGPSSSSNSLHVGLDGQEVASAANIKMSVTGTYLWIGTISNGSRATLDIGTTGSHTVNVWMRESGAVIDKVVLTTDVAFDPSTINGGLGPDESVQGNPTDADLAVSKAVDNSTPVEGDTIIYTVSVTNGGPIDASGVIVTDLLPSGLTFAGDDAAASGTFYDSATGIWTVGPLANGQSATLNITATVDVGTGGSTLTNTASVTASDQPDPVVGNNSAAINLTVVAPGTDADLAVTKSVDNAAPNEGDTILYTVTVTNNGPSDATGVTLSDVLPAGVSYVSDDAGGSYSGGVWAVGSLVNAASATLNITATVDAGTAGSTITNTASVSALDQTDAVPGNDSAAVAINVVPVGGGGGGFQQDGSGLVSMEAESYQASVVSPD
ncbi:MAG: DUF11 domain-containing protein, partial [Gemmatimonadota bacterium]